MKKQEVIGGIGFALLSGLLYTGILYFTPRSETMLLLGQWGGLFALYAGFLYWRSQHRNEQTIPLWIGVGIAFRLLAWFALPLLSDDYFRFIWDGTLLGAGENPFMELPSAYFAQPERMAELGLTPELYEGLNSKEYFTIYPPVLQFIFWVGASLFPNQVYGAVWVMKSFVVAAEIGTLLLLKRWLARWRPKTKYWVLLYALNPLVIIELSGNLHFEALMIFFLLLAITWLTEQKWLFSSIAFSLAVTSKLLPLIIMPLLIRRIGWKKTLVYGTAVGGWTLLQFLPLFDLETFLHIKESISLYVNVFEFNASIWYALRYLGELASGWNLIREVGPLLSVLVVILIADYSLHERKPEWHYLPKGITRVFLIYFALATIVHPWYVSTLVAFGCVTSLRFPMLWSALIPLSYVAYHTPGLVQENAWLIGLEYGLLTLMVLYESRFKRVLNRKG